MVGPLLALNKRGIVEESQWMRTSKCRGSYIAVRVIGRTYLTSWNEDRASVIKRFDLANRGQTQTSYFQRYFGELSPSVSKRQTGLSGGPPLAAAFLMSLVWTTGGTRLNGFLCKSTSREPPRSSRSTGDNVSRFSVATGAEFENKEMTR